MIIDIFFYAHIQHEGEQKKLQFYINDIVLIKVADDHNTFTLLKLNLQ